MKKFVTIFAVVLVAVAMVLSVSAANVNPIEGRKTAEVFVGNVTIDGTVDEVWQYATKITCEGIYEGTKQEGTEYASLDVSVLWNGTNELYVLFDVKDPLICKASNEDYKNDNAEWYFDFNNFNDQNGGVDLSGHVYPDETAESVNHKVVCKKTDDGYMAELVVYLDGQSVTLAAGDYIGADFQINEDANNDGERDICVRWSASNWDFFMNCYEFGQLLLSADTASAPEVEEPGDDTDTGAPDTGDMAVAMVSVAVTAAAVMVIAKKRLHR